MIVARPPVAAAALVGVDEIWRPQPPQWLPRSGLGHGLGPLPGPLQCLRTGYFGAGCWIRRRWLPSRASSPDFDSVRLAKRPQCSSVRRYPVLEVVLLLKRQRTAASRPGCGPQAPASAEEAAPCALADRAQLAAALAAPCLLPGLCAPLEAIPAPAETETPDIGGLLSSAQAEQMRPDLLTSAVIQPCAIWLDQAASTDSASMGAPEPARSPRSPRSRGRSPTRSARSRGRSLQRQDSEWSLVTFSSLRTDESVELSEVESDGDEDAAHTHRRHTPCRPTSRAAGLGRFDVP